MVKTMTASVVRVSLTVGVITLLFQFFPLAAQMNHGDEHAGPTMNHHVIDERLATGGHFVNDGLVALNQQGLQVVIDLRDNPPAGQKEKLAEMGIKWINVPVEWTNPRNQDFELFSAAMTRHKSEKVLVQCQANYRASVMTYLYRVKVEQVPVATASGDLNAVWEPNDQWRDYMDGIISN